MDIAPHWLTAALGLATDAKDLTFMQMSLRGVVVFVAALVMVRFGDKRFLSQKTAFDVVLGFILASMLARAVNGNSAFVPTLGTGFVLVALHRLIATLARRSHRFGSLVKGHSTVVVRDGRMLPEAMREHDLSEHDLHEDLRLHGNVDSVEAVKLAVYERNGTISSVMKERT